MRVLSLWDTVRERCPPRLRNGLQVLGRFVREVGRAYQMDNGPLLAAGMAFYALLSLIPLLLLAITALSWVYGSSEVAQQQVADWLRANFPQGSEDIIQRVSALLSDPSLRWTSGLNLLGLLYAGQRFFALLTHALNVVWEGARRRSFWSQRLTALLAMLMAGLFLGLSVLLSSVLAAVRGWQFALGPSVKLDLQWLWTLADYATPWGLSIAFFFLLYKWLPNAQVSVPTALLAALFSGSVWELLRYLITSHLAALFVRAYGLMYGPLAGIVLLMLWIYFGSAILLFGAEMASVMQTWGERTRSAASRGDGT
jgi:membrane protein